MSKTVLITGASGGIGSAAAKAFAMDGYKVYLHYNTNDRSVLYLMELFKNNGCACRAIKADLRNPDEISSLAKSAHDAEILINNAGVSFSGTFSDMTDYAVSSVINTDLVSQMLLTKYMLPYMLGRKRGKIINVSSIWGISGASCEVAYSAAKAGVIGFTKALAKEVGPSGINVNCIAPGVINTEMMGSYTLSDIASLAQSTPLGRLGEPSDIASLMLYLASPASDFITGQVISPNGGFLI